MVVGLPVSLSGAEGQQAAEARAFRDALAAILDVPVETYDERLTTRMAERSARAGGERAAPTRSRPRTCSSPISEARAARGVTGDWASTRSRRGRGGARTR